jgi:hypothetical protein
MCLACLVVNIELTSACRDLPHLQEPLLNATTGPDGNPFGSLLPQAGSGAAAGAGAGSTGGNMAAAGGAADQPSSQPLPNPWAPQGGAAGELCRV